MPVTKVCVVCSKEFNVSGRRVLTAKTCSQKCRGVLIAKAYEDQRLELQCKWCGKRFKVPKSHADRRVYCSYKCAGDAQRGVPIGPFSPDGATALHSGGYVLERSASHPFNVHGYVFQHRLVMEAWLRDEAPAHPFLVDVGGTMYLRRDIDVHHRNECKSDNQRQNLMACTSAAHRDLHKGRRLMRGTVWPESGDEIEAVARRVTVSCLECGKTFERKLSDVRRGNGKFCSVECKSEWRIKQSGSKVLRRCIQCGTEFLTWPALVARNGGKFCSNPCRHKSRIGRNPNEVIPYDKPS